MSRNSIANNRALVALMQRNRLTRNDVAKLLDLPLQQDSRREAVFQCATVGAWLAPRKSRKFRVMPTRKLNALKAKIKTRRKRA